MPLVMRTGAQLEPLSVEDAKAHLRIDGAAEDVLLTSLILTSRLHIEAALGLALIRQDWTLVLDRWPASGIARIPMRPLIDVSAVRVLDADGVAQEVPAVNYFADLASTPGRLVSKGVGWPAPG